MVRRRDRLAGEQSPAAVGAPCALPVFLSAELQPLMPDTPVTPRIAQLLLAITLGLGGAAVAGPLPPGLATYLPAQPATQVPATPSPLLTAPTTAPLMVAPVPVAVNVAVNSDGPQTPRLLSQPLTSQASRLAVQRLLQQAPLSELSKSREVAANPFLAAQLYLRERGLRVDHANSLDVLPRLPPARTSLMLLGDRHTMNPAQVERLMTWVSQGGRLLFGAQAFWDARTGHSDDLLLDRVQLRRYDTHQLPPAEPTGDPFPTLTKLYLDNERAPAYFSFEPSLHLEDPVDVTRSWANSADATHLMQLDYGAGLITVVTDTNLWTNAALGRVDNAWLLWYLNQQRDVALIYPIEPMGVAAALGRYFPQALVLLLACLALYAWQRVAGRRAYPAPAPGRALREQLRASARLRLRREGHSGLLRALQHDILHRAGQRQPGLQRLPVAEQWLAVARLTGHSPSAVGQALRPRPAKTLSATEFTRQVAHLQQLRNAL